MKTVKNAVNLIFEAVVAKRIKRTGWQILGGHEENLGEHAFMTCVIAYLLTKQINNKKINLEKVLLMGLFHDFHETRTGDVDKLSTFYVTRNTEKANKDIFSKTDQKLLENISEYEKRKSIESQIVYEANILALTAELKTLVERGNINAGEWLTANTARLKIKEAQDIAREIVSTSSQAWWAEKRDKIRTMFKL